MPDKPFVPGDISPNIDAAADVVSPRLLDPKPMAQMTHNELFELVASFLGYPSKRAEDLEEIDEKEYKSFMEVACDSWEDLGNNGEPLQPEDLDVDEVPYE